MTKIVRDTHIIGERGVIRFNEYCNRHIPYIMFKENVKHDFGIDGEVEIIKTNEEGKKIASGEILKVQIKSTSSDASYISNETNSSFNFYAKKEDIEYWKKYKLDVLLVIYDDRNDILYCKKIDKEILILAEKKSYSIIFSKIENKLDFSKSDFVERFSSAFKDRVNFDAKEIITTNILDFSSIPKKVYVFETNFKNKKEIYNSFEFEITPYFAIYSQKIYSFENIKLYHKHFFEKIITSNTYKVYSLTEVYENKELRNHYIEILNLYIKKLLSDKRLKFSRDYKRFYFRKPNDNESLIISYESKKQQRKLEKEVVKYYVYGKDKFYRHWAIEMRPLFISNHIYLQINPKYYFTLDGRETLSPEKITKYTNYLTSRERNANIVNQIHFYLNYFSEGKSLIDVWNFNEVEIKLKSEPLKFNVNFGIPLDVQAREKKEQKTITAFQRQLMLDDED